VAGFSPTVATSSDESDALENITPGNPRVADSLINICIAICGHVTSSPWRHGGTRGTVLFTFNQRSVFVRLIAVNKHHSQLYPVNILLELQLQLTSDMQTVAFFPTLAPSLSVLLYVNCLTL